MPTAGYLKGLLVDPAFQRAYRPVLIATKENCLLGYANTRWLDRINSATIKVLDWRSMEFE